MRNWLRRIRGALGMGVTWAAASAAVGLVPRWVLGLSGDLPFPILFGALGFIAGVVFSGLLVLTEGRRRFDELSLPRFAAWGAVGGLLLSALFVRGANLGWRELLAISTTFAVASAACAAGSLAVEASGTAGAVRQPWRRDAQAEPGSWATPAIVTWHAGGSCFRKPREPLVELRVPLRPPEGATGIADWARYEDGRIWWRTIPELATLAT